MRLGRDLSGLTGLFKRWYGEVSSSGSSCSSVKRTVVPGGCLRTRDLLAEGPDIVVDWRDEMREYQLAGVRARVATIHGCGNSHVDRT
jgi:hypothetical protein